jgi:N-acylglucosamine 2-epimerase/mannose-6-phosphate isomerase
MDAPPIRFDAVRSWLFETALPFWAEAGVDRRDGGFVEQLDLSGRDGGVPFKRTRAQARQIYCFSHAALMGWEPGRAVSDHGWQFLTAHGRRGDGGWVRRMGRAGGALDQTCDAYDMAFALFAHGWRHRLTGDDAIVDSALETVEALDRLLRHPNGLGWRAEENDEGPRQQNPHMHIIEAAIELAESTGHPRFRALVEEVLGLFQVRFFDRDAGVLREFYNADWSRLDSPEGRIVEPGHMMEWSWILYRAERLLGLDCRADARRLFETAERIGVAAGTGLTLDQVDAEGAVIAGGSRSWPQTETLKAHLAVLENDGVDTRAGIARCVDNLLDRYLAAPALPGAWIDQFDAAGNPAADKIPPTTFYHVLLAFSELLRLEPRIEAMG